MIRKVSQDQQQWLAAAAIVLAEAERLTGLLARNARRDDDAFAKLEARVAGLRREVELLRRGRTGARLQQNHPNWTQSSPWTPRP